MPNVLSGTPRADGFQMPAEWAPHRGCYLVWPERPDNWRLGAKPAQAAWVQVAEAISRTEQVTVLASSRQWRNARARLPARVRVVEATSDDAWVRDNGPTFVVAARAHAADDESGDRALRAVDWAFNAWGGLRGGLYFPWDSDDILGHKIAELESVDCYQPPVVMEGGSFDVDGEGTLLTTAECLLNPNRNPDLDAGQIEEHLRDQLGVQKIIWLPRGVYLDETDGHVDNMARFVAPGVVLLTWTDDQADPQHERSSQALDVLRSATDARGRTLEVVTMHQPEPMHVLPEEAESLDLGTGSRPRLAGERLAGSYVNAYFGNGIVVFPAFDDPHDAIAAKTYERLFPDRIVVPVPGREILLGGGNVHCITQQVPLPPHA